MTTHLALLFAAALASEPVEPPPSPGKLTARTLDAHLDQLIPIVEDVTGRTFTSRPEIVMNRPGATRQVYVSELTSMSKQLYPGMDDASARNMAFWVGQDEFPYLLGKYALETDTIYLRPKAVLIDLIERDVPRRHLQDALRLVLVHELAHALQDQTAGLGDQFDAVTSWEAFRGLNMVTEGHAVAVEHAVAQRLGIADVSEVLNDKLGDTYFLGHTFVNARSEDPARNWDVIETPPAHTGQVIYPETWNDGRDPVPVGHAPWFVVTEALGFGEMGGLNRDVGAYDLHLSLLPISWKTREALARGVTTGRVWNGRQERTELEISFWGFETPEQAAAVVAAVEVEKEALAARNPWSDAQEFSVAPNLVRDTPVQGLDLAHVRYTVDFQQTYGDSFRKVSVWAANGPLLMRVETWWANPSDEQLAAAMNGVLGKIGATDASAESDAAPPNEAGSDASSDD